MSLFLPYTIQFSVRGERTCYAEVARFLGLPSESEEKGAASLVSAIRGLLKRLGQPTTIGELGISPDKFEAGLTKLVENAENDSMTITSPRIPRTEEFEQLFRYAYEGRSVDF